MGPRALLQVIAGVKTHMRAHVGTFYEDEVSWTGVIHELHDVDTKHLTTNEPLTTIRPISEASLVRNRDHETDRALFRQARNIILSSQLIPECSEAVHHRT